jgi:hypothetical protein
MPFRLPLPLRFLIDPESTQRFRDLFDHSRPEGPKGRYAREMPWLRRLASVREASPRKGIARRAAEPFLLTGVGRRAQDARASLECRDRRQPRWNRGTTGSSAIERFGYSLEELARVFEHSKCWVSGRLALIRALPEAIQDYVRLGSCQITRVVHFVEITTRWRDGGSSWSSFLANPALRIMRSSSRNG